jgi:hypothetical protein
LPPHFLILRRSITPGIVRSGQNINFFRINKKFIGEELPNRGHRKMPVDMAPEIDNTTYKK